MQSMILKDLMLEKHKIKKEIEKLNLACSKITLKYETKITNLFNTLKHIEKLQIMANIENHKEILLSLEDK